jgi:hypothetical protein
VCDKLASQVAQQGFAVGFLSAQVVYFVSVTHDICFYEHCTVSGIAVVALFTKSVNE